MSDLAHSRSASRKTVMETIMKPLSYARRAARWLMAAGIAVAMMPALPASLANRRLSGSRKRPGFSWTRVMTAKTAALPKLPRTGRIHF